MKREYSNIVIDVAVVKDMYLLLKDIKTQEIFVFSFEDNLYILYEL